LNDTQGRDLPTTRVLCLTGSLRRESWNRRLLAEAVRTAPKGLELSLFDEMAAVPMFNEDTEQVEAAGVHQLRSAVAMADGLLIATPEYNHSFPGVLKNAIDWLSRGSPSVLVDKPAAIIGASAGRWGTRLAQAALRQVLTATEVRVMPAPMLFLAQASECFDNDGRIRDPSIARGLSGVMDALRKWIRVHEASIQ
jgi:chromate reductase, NAD(P)H dehydrogenase (quinone)